MARQFVRVWKEDKHEQCWALPPRRSCFLPPRPCPLCRCRHTALASLVTRIPSRLSFASAPSARLSIPEARSTKSPLSFLVMGVAILPRACRVPELRFVPHPLLQQFCDAVLTLTPRLMSQCMLLLILLLLMLTLLFDFIPPYFLSRSGFAAQLTERRCLSNIIFSLVGCGSK